MSQSVSEGFIDFPKISIFQGNSRRSDKIPGLFQNVSGASLKVLVKFQEAFQRCFSGSHVVSAGLRRFWQDSKESQEVS